jgi:hypothetical protein
MSHWEQIAVSNRKEKTRASYFIRNSVFEFVATVFGLAFWLAAGFAAVRHFLGH